MPSPKLSPQIREQNRRCYSVYRKTKEGRLVQLLSGAKSRSKKLNAPFDLTHDWLRAKLDAGRCQATGLPLSFEAGDGQRNRNPWVASLDQIVPGAGYTQDNTQVVCWIYNCAKAVNSKEDVLLMAKALVEKQTAIDLQPRFG